MPTHIEPRSKYRRAAACNPPMGWMQTCSTHNIPPPALSFSGSPVDRCPLLAMHWPNILGVGSWRGGSDVDKWDRGVSSDPRGLGEGGSNSAETDLLFEGFVLAMLSLPLLSLSCFISVKRSLWGLSEDPHLTHPTCRQQFAPAHIIYTACEEWKGHECVFQAQTTPQHMANQSSCP